ncbi:hypothetical protein HUK80_09375 [Flavobacterium sp. MAH-1]|uniref:Uncharacterized protein n=1 Tax=Flavobacterium agri TaxID=2743471 RepID=A0A7Y8Y381_9FLAO|nr:hypothetical protein [Flavobacterium agri]NUY81104.1 hypothetical protein [Flavobacterium agri]NYA71128.1 hypothetical protein [Flavobacterium agri]
MELSFAPFLALFGMLSFAPILMLFIDGWRSKDKDNSWKNVGAFVILTGSAIVLLKFFGLVFVFFVPLVILGIGCIKSVTKKSRNDP